MNTAQNVKQFKDRSASTQNTSEYATASQKENNAITALNQCLAHSIELGSRIKQAHWSAKGENFYIFKMMAGDFTAQLSKQSDKLSARIVAIEGVPNWTSEKVAKTSLLPSYPMQLVSVADHIEALTSNYEDVANQLQKALSEAKLKDDYVTTQVMTNFSQVIDEQKSFLLAHSGLAWLEKPKRQYG